MKKSLMILISAVIAASLTDALAQQTPSGSRFEDGIYTRPGSRGKQAKASEKTTEDARKDEELDALIEKTRSSEIYLLGEEPKTIVVPKSKSTTVKFGEKSGNTLTIENAPDVTILFNTDPWYRWNTRYGGMFVTDPRFYRSYYYSPYYYRHYWSYRYDPWYRWTYDPWYWGYYDPWYRDPWFAGYYDPWFYDPWYCYGPGYIGHHHHHPVQVVTTKNVVYGHRGSTGMTGTSKTTSNARPRGLTGVTRSSGAVSSSSRTASTSSRSTVSRGSSGTVSRSSSSTSARSSASSVTRSNNFRSSDSYRSSSTGSSTGSSYNSGNSYNRGSSYSSGGSSVSSGSSYGGGASSGASRSGGGGFTGGSTRHR